MYNKELGEEVAHLLQQHTDIGSVCVRAAASTIMTTGGADNEVITRKTIQEQRACYWSCC